MSEPLLTTENIRRTYRIGRHVIPVLRGVELTVQRGETVAVTGASGSGKSTLLYLLGGLDQPTGGAVHFAGQSIYAMPPARRARFRAQSLGFVFQSYHLLPELDLLENVMLPSMASARFARLTPGQRQRAEELLERVGLQDRLHHRPAELSGGEQQRAALARALMNAPELVLADEPTGNLDDETGGRVLHYLFDLIRENQQTLLLVTHDDSVAGRCGRTLRLSDGTLSEREKP
jgi:predicted ABC-type transport system involved in lysophospholipase L1 biosynthesis ATPase subunit